MSSWPLLDGLTADDADQVIAAGARRRFRRGDFIVHEGDAGAALHLVDAGHVAVQTTTPMGDVAMLRVIGPGGHFGELSIVAPGPRNATISALDSVETLVLTAADVDQLRSDHPAVDRLLVQALVAEVRRLSTQVLDAYYLTVPVRTMGRLVELARLYPAEGDGSVVLPFTQEEVAQLVGTARPTVNKVLQDLQDQRLVRVTRGKVTVLDLDALDDARLAAW